MLAHLLHCFKELYQIGSVTMPAINFCGSVNAKAMLPKGTFEGYNERGLSLKDALELKENMLRAYLGDGHESIALMFMEPLKQLATDSSKGRSLLNERTYKFAPVEHFALCNETKVGPNQKLWWKQLKTRSSL